MLKCVSRIVGFDDSFPSLVTPAGLENTIALRFSLPVDATAPGLIGVQSTKFCLGKLRPKAEVTPGHGPSNLKTTRLYMCVTNGQMVERSSIHPLVPFLFPTRS